MCESTSVAADLPFAQKLCTGSAERKGAAVVVGASSGVGRALAEALAERGLDLVLVATDARDLAAACADLQLRWGIHAYAHLLDLSDLQVDFRAAVAHWQALLGPFQILLLPAGYVASDDDRLASRSVLLETLFVNYAAIAGLAAECGRMFEERGAGTIVGFSSIAARVPRRRNMAYAASKAALETHLRALRHYFADSTILVQIYVLGYVDSAMSYGQRLLLPAVSPQSVANRVVSRLSCDVGTVFFPSYWRWITALLGNLPWWAYRRLRF